MMTRKETFGIALAGLFTGIALLPYVWWMWVLTYAYRAYRHLGHWPKYGTPDPKDLPETLIGSPAALEYFIPWGTYVVFLGAVLWLICRTQTIKTRLILSSTLIPALWAAWILLLKIDPFGIMEWIFD